MRISVFIYISVVIISSTTFPEKIPHSLNKNLVEADINLIVEERMVIRFDKSLEYTQTQRPYMNYLLDDRLELKTNTLREKKALFKIPTNPLKPSNLIVTFPLR